jgi:hypothetical protein
MSWTKNVVWPFSRSSSPNTIATGDGPTANFQALLRRGFSAVAFCSARLRVVNLPTQNWIRPSSAKCVPARARWQGYASVCVYAV